MREKLQSNTSLTICGQLSKLGSLYPLLHVFIYLLRQDQDQDLENVRFGARVSVFDMPM